MVSEFLVGMMDGVAVMWGISPTLALYLHVFVFAFAIGLSLTLKTKNPLAGVVGFLGTLLVFAMLDAFPLWIIAIPLILVLVIHFYLSKRD